MTSDSRANVSHDAKDSGNRVMEGLNHTKYSQNKTTQERQHSLKEMKVKIKLLTLMEKKRKIKGKHKTQDGRQRHTQLV